MNIIDYFFPELTFYLKGIFRKEHFILTKVRSVILF